MDDDKIENWADRTTSKPYQACEKFYAQIKKAYDNREEADESIAEYWNIYNATPDDNQMYQGNSKCYVPAVRDGINARAKRALKQLFPQRYKHVDAIGSDGIVPRAHLAMQEHYIRSTKLKSICRSMLVSGDVTGQWNLYIDWAKTKYTITNMIKKNPALLDDSGEELEISDPDTEVEELEEHEIFQEGPTVSDLATEDLVVIPPTIDDIEKADLVSVKLRMSKENVRDMERRGIFIIPKDTELSEWMEERSSKEKRSPPKKRAGDAGIKTEGTFKYLLVYEVTARIEFEKGKKSLAYIYFAGEKIVGLIKAPQWGQKRPVISAPVERISGSFFGISKIEAVKWLQWNLNDFWNMGQDSGAYAMLPIVMTDPEKNPNYAMMVYGLAAVWPTSPESTKFAQFPALWKDSISMCQAIKAQINESLETNEMMMGQMPKGRKNAGMVGSMQQEQSVAVLDQAERFEEVILNPLLERFFEYDAQFREEDLTVLSMGDIGIKAEMEVIPPLQWENRYFYQWCGTEYVNNMQRMQQQIATMNVLRGIPPQQLNGRKLDIAPILEILTDNVFGSELSGRILIDERNQYTVPPELEDEMMLNGMLVEVHEADNDIEHLQVHQIAGQKSGDHGGFIRTHMQSHMQALQKKRQMAAPPPQGMPGVPGGAGPGVAGTPTIGAQPAMMKPAQNPPGSIGPDQMPGQPGRG